MSLEDLDPKAEQLRIKGRDQGQLDLPLAPHRASSGRRPSRGGPKGAWKGRRELSRLHAKCTNSPTISYETTGVL